MNAKTNIEDHGHECVDQFVDGIIKSANGIRSIWMDNMTCEEVEATVIHGNGDIAFTRLTLSDIAAIMELFLAQLRADSNRKDMEG